MRTFTRADPLTDAELDRLGDFLEGCKSGKAMNLEALDGFFAATDERSRNRFRSGLYAAARTDRVSVRGLPDGSVRVTKVGEWSRLGA